MTGVWLTPAESGRRLKVSPQTVANWADLGRIRYTETPTGQRRYAAADVEAFDPPAPTSRIFWLEVDGSPVKVRAEISMSPSMLAQLASLVALTQADLDRGVGR